MSHAGALRRRIGHRQRIAPGFLALNALPIEAAIHPTHRKALRDLRTFPARGVTIVD